MNLHNIEDWEIYPYERLERQPQKSRRPKAKKRAWRRPKFDISEVKRLKPVLRLLVERDNLLFWLGCLVLSRSFIMGEVMPFAFAFTGSWLPDKRYQRIFGLILCGLGFASVSSGWLWAGNLLACTLILFLLPKFSSSRISAWMLRPLLVVLMVFVAKSLFVALMHPTFYRVMVYVFEAMMAGILTFVFMIAREAITDRKEIQEYSYEEMTAAAILVVSFLMGLMNIDYHGVTLVGTLCRLVIMIAALIWGAAGATMVGVFTGAIPAIANTMFPQTLAVYAITGLLAGLFRYFGRLGVFLGFLAGSLLFTVFNPSVGHNIGSLWETAIAGLAFFLLPSSLQPQPTINSLGPIGSTAGPVEIRQFMQQVAGDRLARLARVFDEMASTFGPESEEKEEAEDGFKQILEQIAAGLCAGCSLNSSCWDRDFYRTYRDLLTLVSQLGEKEDLAYEEISESIRRRCVRPKELVAAVSFLVKSHKDNSRWEKVVEESQEVVSAQLKGVAELMAGLAGGLKNPAEIDDELRLKLLMACRKHFLPVKDVVPVIMGGQAYLHVMGQGCSGNERCREDIAPVLSSLMGKNYVVSDCVCPRGKRGSCQFTLVPHYNYRVETGVAQTSRGVICGDSFTVATIKGAEEMILLSDGMGTGQKAARESRLAVRMLEELLSSGFSPERAIKSVNSVLHLRSKGERFVTLDLAVINLESAEADMIKVCAAPSFLKRGAAVNIISGSALPAGVFDTIEPTIQSLLLQAGDVLVMVSDGLLEAGGNSMNWLPAFLSVVDESDPQRLADLIMGKALERVRGQVRDDMTVLCSRIELNYW